MGSKYTPKIILQRLLDGNKRFVSGNTLNPNQGKDRIIELSESQNPVAAIVGCADSRVPPAIVFDQGLGDLFVVRTAGNLIDDLALGSIEYATEYLGVELIVVLGHSKCGAVEAAVQNTNVSGNIKTIINKIKPAVKKAKDLPGDLTDNAVKENVKLVANKIKTSKPILTKLYKDNKINIESAFYEVETGKVHMI